MDCQLKEDKPLCSYGTGVLLVILESITQLYMSRNAHTKKDPFAVLFSESKKHNPHDHKQESKIATQEQNAILTQLKTK